MEGSAVKCDAFNKQYANFSGSAGLTYAASKNVNLKFNIARAFRAPSIPELSSNGAHEGTIRYEYGNRNLNSEISTQFDAAVTLNREHFSFNLAGYYNHFSNFIYYRKLQNISGSDSLVDVGGNYLTAFTFDQQAANMYGTEITLDIHPHPLDWLHIENSFSYVRGKFATAMEGSKNLPFIPAPKLLTEFRADFKKLHKSIKNFYAKYEIENTFRQNNAFTAYNTESSSKGYVLMNIGVGAEIYNQKNKQILGIYLSALNIGDVAYQSHLSRLKYAAVNSVTGREGVFNMGRNFGIKVNVPIDF
jgi:iron complex outermembrane receptor protein